jgi:hypothetical protein
MPLRDYFRPPTTKFGSWESLHGMWPAAVVQQLRKQLPPGYISAPRVHLGPYSEIDIAAFQTDDDAPRIGADSYFFFPSRNSGISARVKSTTSSPVTVLMS